MKYILVISCGFQEEKAGIPTFQVELSKTIQGGVNA